MEKTLNTIGVILMLLTILLILPSTLPKLRGYTIYNVTSESMEPEYKVGTAVFIKEAPFEDIEVNDVIGFYVSDKSESIATHRVVEIDKANKTFTTKGDANNANDADPVSYQNVCGKVFYSIPYYGDFIEFKATFAGKVLFGTVFVITLGLWVTAALMAKLDKK